jgi:outer membrane protein assembly factor BamB
MRRGFVLGSLLLLASTARAEDDVCPWTQWGRDAEHDGQVCVPGQDPVRVLAHLTFDPFVADEQAESNGDLLAHYQVPILDGDDVFVMTKTGVYTACDPPGSGQPAPCGTAAWNGQIWNERRLHWRGGALVEMWRFASDWKPEPTPDGWEPMFQPVLAGGFLYVPGAGGTVWKVHRATGAARRIDPFGGALRPDRYVAGGLAADAGGNVYYNALELDHQSPWTVDAHGWLVKIAPSGATRKVSYDALTPGAPGPNDLCRGTYRDLIPLPPRPWPPALNPADCTCATPERCIFMAAPQIPCQSQRPAINLTPAIGGDGTIYTGSRMHSSALYSYLIALRPDLTLKWATSLRGYLDDGCGVTVPYDSDLRHPGLCHCGAPLGVDPATGQQPAASVTEASSSAPVALPDGTMVYGSVDSYNGGGRGHLLKLDGDGAIVANFDFGWDVTPAVYRHDGTYSVVLKDNHYISRLPDLTPVEGPYFITQLDKDLVPEWKFASTNTETCLRQPDGTVSCFDDGSHENGFEWCINAPAVDSEGTVYVTSEDGNFYAIRQGGIEKTHVFLDFAVGAAYTPLAIDSAGRIFAMNNGELTVLGR